jgi:hypothetical protein
VSNAWALGTSAPTRNHASSLTISPCQGHSSGSRTNPARTEFCRTIFPLFGVALAVTNQMIEKALLPMRRLRSNRCRQSALKNSHPLPQREVQVAANKKMNVIWHDHITPQANSAQLALLSEMNQRVVHARVCKKFPALMRIKSNKIQWWIIPLKDTMQPRRSMRHGTKGNVVAAL